MVQSDTEFKRIHYYIFTSKDLYISEHLIGRETSVDYKLFSHSNNECVDFDGRDLKAINNACL